MSESKTKKMPKSPALTATAPSFEPSSERKKVDAHAVPVGEDKRVDERGEHKLQTSWAFFSHKKPQQHQQSAAPAAAAGAAGGSGGAAFKNYESQLHKLGTFNSLEGFWKLFSWLAQPEDLPVNHDLYLMRNGDVPAWETFPNGGNWFVKVRKGNKLVNRLWEELVFACVGELFAEPAIAGVAVCVRPKDDTLQVWLRDASNPDQQFVVGEKIREILNMGANSRIEFKPFSLALQDGSSFRGAKSFVYAARPTY